MPEIYLVIETMDDGYFVHEVFDNQTAAFKLAEALNEEHKLHYDIPEYDKQCKRYDVLLFTVRSKCNIEEEVEKRFHWQRLNRKKLIKIRKKEKKTGKWHCFFCDSDNPWEQEVCQKCGMIRREG